MHSEAISANFCPDSQTFVKLYYHSVSGNKYVEIQHQLKKQATWTFYYAYDGILFIIAILVNSKQLRENEKTYGFFKIKFLF